MMKQWNPVDGFETLMAQLTKGLILAQYAGAPISDIDVVDMVITNILDTGLFADKYKKMERKNWPKKVIPSFQNVLGGASSPHETNNQDGRQDGIWNECHPRRG